MQRIAFTAALLACPSLATAQADESPGRLHLALEGTLFEYSKATLDFGGLTGERESRVITVGYPAIIGARVGYLARDFLEAGGLFNLRYQSQEDEELSGKDGFSIGAYEFAAYARYVAPGERARLFAGPRIGGTFAKQSDPDEDGNSGAESRARALTIGLDLGLYAFIAESFSIDPSLTFAYQTGSLEIDVDSEDVEIDASGFEVGLTLALSGWISMR